MLKYGLTISAFLVCFVLLAQHKNMPLNHFYKREFDRWISNQVENDQPLKNYHTDVYPLIETWENEANDAIYDTNKYYSWAASKLFKEHFLELLWDIYAKK